MVSRGNGFLSLFSLFLFSLFLSSSQAQKASKFPRIETQRGDVSVGWFYEPAKDRFEMNIDDHDDLSGNHIAIYFQGKWGVDGKISAGQVLRFSKRVRSERDKQTLKEISRDLKKAQEYIDRFADQIGEKKLLEKIQKEAPEVEWAVGALLRLGALNELITIHRLGKAKSRTGENRKKREKLRQKLKEPKKQAKRQRTKKESQGSEKVLPPEQQSQRKPAVGESFGQQASE